MDKIEIREYILKNKDLYSEDSIKNQLKKSGVPTEEIEKEFTEIYNGNLSNGLKENTSGLGENSKIPEEIKKWNWGAFFFNWIWGLSNNVYIALLCFIPFVNFFMLFYLGFKGNELAWKAKRWESIESFISTQKKWSLIGITIFGSIFSLVLILILIQTF